MAPVLPDYEKQVAAWPSPVQLMHQEGDLYVTLIHHENYIEAKWSGHINADDVVTAAQVYLALLEKTPNPRLLNDKTGATGDWSEANDWLEFEWLPQAIQYGLRCLAHVYSSNMFSWLSARDLYQRLTPSISIHNFSDRESAEAWLLSYFAADGAA